MIIDKITFTGADNKVDRQQLYNISDVNDRVEWGILIYPKKYGEQRFPTTRWIRDFIRYKPEFVQSSAHLCGSSIFGFTHNPNYREYISNFDRVQLNISDSDHVGMAILIGSIMDFEDEYSKPVILQYNKENKPMVDTVLDYINWIDILFDSSRGQGKMKFDISDSLNEYCGYAGGINPENVKNVITILNTMFFEDQQIWIDTESGIRTKNEFDTNKIMLILKEIYNMGY